MQSKGLSGSYVNLPGFLSQQPSEANTASSNSDVRREMARERPTESLMSRERLTARRWSNETQGRLRPGNSAVSLGGVIETDYLQAFVSNGVDAKTSQSVEDVSRTGRQTSGLPMTDRKASIPLLTPERALDQASCVRVRALLSRALASPTRAGGREAYRVVASDDLITRISADVVRMSQCEPMGTAGCRLRVKLDWLKPTANKSRRSEIDISPDERNNKDNDAVTVDESQNEMDPQQPIESYDVKISEVADTVTQPIKIEPIPSVVSSSESDDALVAEIRLADGNALTSEVVLSLKESEKTWHGLGHALSHALRCLGPASSRCGRVYISPAYRLEKIKLYTTAAH